jgi:hypothetical protein
MGGCLAERCGVGRVLVWGFRRAQALSMLEALAWVRRWTCAAVCRDETKMRLSLSEAAAVEELRAKRDLHTKIKMFGSFFAACRKFNRLGAVVALWSAAAGTDTLPDLLLLLKLYYQS